MIPIEGDFGSSAPMALGNASLAMPMQQGSGKPMDLKKQMALQMIAQQLGKMGGQGAPQMSPMRQQLDIYGNPVG